MNNDVLAKFAYDLVLQMIVQVVVSLIFHPLHWYMQRKKLKIQGFAWNFRSYVGFLVMFLVMAGVTLLSFSASVWLGQRYGLGIWGMALVAWGLYFILSLIVSVVAIQLSIVMSDIPLPFTSGLRRRNNLTVSMSIVAKLAMFLLLLGLLFIVDVQGAPEPGRPLLGLSLLASLFVDGVALMVIF